MRRNWLTYDNSVFTFKPDSALENWYNERVKRDAKFAREISLLHSFKFLISVILANRPANFFFLYSPTLNSCNYTVSRKKSFNTSVFVFAITVSLLKLYNGRMVEGEGSSQSDFATLFSRVFDLTFPR